MVNQGIFNRLATTVPISQSLLWIGQGLLVVLTFLLFYPALSWMFDAFSSQEHRFQLIGIIILAAFLIYKQTNSRCTMNGGLSLQLRPAPISLYITSCAAFVFNEYLLDIHIISASLCVLAFYATFGFFTSTTVWRKGLLPTLLLIVLLPFGDYLNVYLGFPLRLFSAYVTADTLTALGYASMSSETIIVLENQYSNVDLSCSGIKGIWSGLAFFILLSWVENKPIGPGWFWRLGIFVMVLIGANILRISILVLLGSHFSYFEFADLIHEILGIIGFTLACLVGWGLLLTQNRGSHKKQPEEIQHHHTIKHPHFTLLILLAIVAVLNVLYTPMPKANAVKVNTHLDFPDNWSARTVDLSFQENGFFNRNQAHANKYHLQPGAELTASLIVVHSTYWKGQHDPKNCLISQGYNISNDTTLRLSSKQRVRYMDLSKEGKQYVAIYWFQNSKHITDDYSKRIFTSIIDKNNPWVLSSLLIKNPEHNSLDIREVISPIQSSIHKKIIQAISDEPKN